MKLKRTWHNQINIDNAFSIKDYVDNVIDAYENYRLMSSSKEVTLTVSGWAVGSSVEMLIGKAAIDGSFGFATTGRMLVTIDGETFTTEGLARRLDDVNLDPMNSSNLRDLCGWTYPHIFSVTVDTRATPYHLTLNLIPTYDSYYHDYITYDQRHFTNYLHWHCWDWSNNDEVYKKRKADRLCL